MSSAKHREYAFHRSNARDIGAHVVVAATLAVEEM